MKGLWDITHEMHLINFIIDIRFQPVILFVANEVKKKRMLLGCTSSLPAYLALEGSSFYWSASLSVLTLKEVKCN